MTGDELTRLAAEGGRRGGGVVADAKEAADVEVPVSKGMGWRGGMPWCCLRVSEVEALRRRGRGGCGGVATAVGKGRRGEATRG